MKALNRNGKPLVDTEKLRPTYCVWELTLACNLRCGHCGSRAGAARDDELSTDECLNLVSDLAELGCEVITLSGGEPTLRTDWSTIARAIREQGMIPNMVTNGIGLDAAGAKLMKDSGLSNTAVSVDGPPATHERIRGKGTYPATERAIKLIQDAGLPVTVMTTVNTLNLPHLEEIHEQCRKLGASRWRLQLGKPMGNLDDHEDWVIKPRDLLYLLPRLHRLAVESDLPIGIGDSIGFFGPYDEPLRSVSWKGTAQRWGGCQAGLKAIGIEANGGIKGCLSLQAFAGKDDPFVEGNIRERPLEEIWRDPHAFAYNRCSSAKDLEGFCGSCRKRAICRGGAKCVASAVTGDVLEDPYCYYREAELARRQPIGRVRNVMAAAAAGASMGLISVGCGVAEPEYGVIPDCEMVDCEDPGLDPDARAECCDVAHPDYGVEPQPEYGVEPHPCDNVDCEVPDLDPDVRDECCHVAQPEYGVEPHPCDNVDCEDADLDPDVRDECCHVTQPEYGVEPHPCDNVDCEDPDLDPDVREECCSAVDYGVEPE